MHKLHFDQHFQPYDAAVFLSDLFACPAVFDAFDVLKSKTGEWGKYAAAAKDVEAVVFEEVSTTKLSMDFFDRLSDAGLQSDICHSIGSMCPGVVRATGTIAGCVPEVIDDTPINNKLSRVCSERVRPPSDPGRCCCWTRTTTMICTRHRTARSSCSTL